MSQFKETNSPEGLITPQLTSAIPTTHTVLTTVHKTENLMDQINILQKKFTKLGRHPLGSKGVYHILGLVRFCALKWLNKIRKDEWNRLQAEAFLLPTKYSKSKAQNGVFSITCEDHSTQQSAKLISALLIYWSSLHIKLIKLTQTTNLSFLGKVVIHSNVYSNHKF